MRTHTHTHTNTRRMPFMQKKGRLCTARMRLHYEDTARTKNSIIMTSYSGAKMSSIVQRFWISKYSGYYVKNLVGNFDEQQFCQRTRWPGVTYSVIRPFKRCNFKKIISTVYQRCDVRRSSYSTNCLFFCFLSTLTRPKKYALFCDIFESEGLKGNEAAIYRTIWPYHSSRRTHIKSKKQRKKVCCLWLYRCIPIINATDVHILMIVFMMLAVRIFST